MPRKFLSESSQAGNENQFSESALANMAFLNRSENRDLGGRPPSEYRIKLPPDIDLIKQTNLIPDSLFDDEYNTFLQERASMLYECAKKLIE